MPNHGSANLVVLSLLLALTSDPSIASAQAPYAPWQGAGSIFIDTTPDGANLPADVVLENFPVLIRLHSDFFDFTKAHTAGDDLRFSSADGAPLPYQIEDWDAAAGEAAIWVRVPRIQGNARQPLRIHWGNAQAQSESSGKAVFSNDNHFVSVWHMGTTIVDEVGTLSSQDVNTTIVPGMIGKARHLEGRQGVFAGDKITSLPAAGSSHSTEVWFRAQRPNTTIIGWGNEGGGRGSKVRMQLRSPPHLHIDSDFSDVKAPDRLPMNEWIHVVHTYDNSDGRIYVNGQLAGAAKPTLNIKSPARLWLGGWYHNYDFIGDLDEIRISSVARSAHWVRLQYENQKPMQTLVGPVVHKPDGSADALTLSHERLELAEGTSAKVTAKADGARKLYWILKRDGVERVVAVDGLSYVFEAGRVTGDATASLMLRAVYPDQVTTKTIDITIKEDIEEPVFALKAPAKWDGRSTVVITAAIDNLSAMQSKQAGELRYAWHVNGPAVIKEAADGRLLLKRAMGTGPLTVTLAIDNGGQARTQAVTLDVSEPAKDEWVHRTPAASERPVDGQFIARDDTGHGKITFAGTLEDDADAVFLHVYEGDRRIAAHTAKTGPGRSYSISAKLKAGLVKYRVEMGTGDKVLHRAGDIVCGDAFLIIGQSNAVATDWGEDPAPPVNEWVRTIGATDGSPQGSRLKLWAPAQGKAPGGKSEIGYWGMELGRRLVESQKVPICIINGAVGGTRIDQHQRSADDPTNANTIYGRLLWRVREAGLTHGIRGILWHQGENDQGADGPTGGFGWETYRHYFHEMAGAWKQDYPNLGHIHLFQIWPKSCSMGVNGSDNVLREVQRTLPRDFSRMSIMSTLGIRPPGGCHFPAAGYAEFARLIMPLVERDHYGKKFTQSITPPNLLTAAYVGNAKEEILLTFDQPVIWKENLAGQFYLDGVAGVITGGEAKGNTLTLHLKAPAAGNESATSGESAAGRSAKRITYLDSKSWSQDQLLIGANGIAALTFHGVPIAAP